MAIYSPRFCRFNLSNKLPRLNYRSSTVLFIKLIFWLEGWLVFMAPLSKQYNVTHLRSKCQFTQWQVQYTIVTNTLHQNTKHWATECNCRFTLGAHILLIDCVLYSKIFHCNVVYGTITYNQAFVNSRVIYVYIRQWYIYVYIYYTIDDSPGR